MRWFTIHYNDTIVIDGRKRGHICELQMEMHVAKDVNNCIIKIRPKTIQILI